MNSETAKPKSLIWRIVKIVLLVVLSLVLLFLAFVGVLTLSSFTRSDKISKTSTVENTSGLVQQKGKALYDKDGNRLLLKGVNVGNLLVSEGWLSPYSAGEKLDEEGNIIYDHDNLPTYPELPQETAYEAFMANEKLTTEQKKEIVSLYRQNWFGEKDFAVVKNEMGLNALRLPFYWRDILHENNGVFTLKSEEEAFSYFDSFLTLCQEYEIYCILDLHGAPGSQSGYEHSGSMEGAFLWSDETYQEATIALWEEIARYYTSVKPELGQWIASYDLLNEPCSSYENQNGGSDPDVVFPFYDRIYDAIRAKGDNHVITMEGVWSFDNFHDPKKYEWENIQYETHFYNWSNDTIPYWLFNNYHELHNWGHDYDVPYLIGEFTFFDDEQAWLDQLSMYDKRGYNWTFWTYKASVCGWWTTTWSVMTHKMNLHETKGLKVNLKTDDYETMKSMCEAVNSENCEYSNTYGYVRKHMGLA